MQIVAAHLHEENLPLHPEPDELRLARYPASMICATIFSCDIRLEVKLPPALGTVIVVGKALFQ